MTVGPITGSAAYLGIENASPVTKLFEFLDESVRKTGTIIDTGGIRGTRSHLSERTRAGNYTVAGTINMAPSHNEIKLLLPWILGADEATGTFALAETVQPRNVWIYRGDFAEGSGHFYKYASCYVNRATFSGSEGGAIQLSLEIVGTTEVKILYSALTMVETTFLGLAVPTDVPYLFTDDVFTMQSTATKVKDWSITIDNNLQVQFYNTTTASRIFATDRLITASHTVPYGGNEALYDQALAGAAATHVLNNGSHTVTFTFGTLQVPAESPVTPSKQETMLTLNTVARTLSTAKELVVTTT